MHPALLDAFVTMLPRIEAEQHLAGATISSLPHMKDGDRRDWYRSQVKRALGDQRPRATKPAGPEQMARGLAGSGVGLRVVVRGGEGSGGTGAPPGTPTAPTPPEGTP